MSGVSLPCCIHVDTRLGDLYTCIYTYGCALVIGMTLDAPTQILDMLSYILHMRKLITIILLTTHVHVHNIGEGS